MIYRELGKTGIKISSLGFGCMRLPMLQKNGKKEIDQEKVDKMLLKAFELGVNYFDTAWFYNDGLSEIAVGKAVKSFRDKIYLSSKSPGHLVKKEGDYRRILEEQLTKMAVDYLDVYHFHGIGYENFLSADKASNWLAEAQKAKDEGLIKHIAFSFHDEAENLVKLVDLGCFESLLCQYSVVDRSNEEAMAYAKSKGLGVIVMGPLGGGRVTGLPRELTERLGIGVKSNAELALRFVFANKSIDCALSGMENIKMLIENAAVSEQREALSEQEVDAITKVMKENEKLSDLYCTGCGYCMPCPAGVNIPHIFRMMNYFRIYNIKEYARNGYAEIGTHQWLPGKRADACTSCGACEKKCPQKIEIIKQLNECHKALG